MLHTLKLKPEPYRQQWFRVLGFRVPRDIKALDGSGQGKGV